MSLNIVKIKKDILFVSYDVQAKQKMQNVNLFLRVSYSAEYVCFRMGHFVMVPLNLALSTLFATHFL